MRRFLSHPEVAKPSLDATTAATMIIDGREVEVELRPNPRARRIILRMNKAGSGVRVTQPPGVGRHDALAFAERHREWISERLAATPGRVAFDIGASIPFRGQPHEIVLQGSRRGTVTTGDSADGGRSIIVAGNPAHAPRRVADWLKREARTILSERCMVHAQGMGLKYARLRVRDQTSRWGSCSSSGTLSFSWRLVMTPDHVLDYVAAHEVAHLAEMNHSARFWSIVDTAVPDMTASRDWLKQHGSALHRFG